MHRAPRKGCRPPVVSVLVCTRDRPVELQRSVLSLLSYQCIEMELIIVDQSDHNDSQDELQALIADGRIRYIRSASRGKGAAMNEGLRIATSPFVVCTDDDCQAPPGWVAGMAALLESKPRVGVAFCRVEAPPHDETKGYVPQYLPARDCLIRSALESRCHRGLGAGMVVRRHALLAIGGVDESFGPRARFQSGDDWDLEIRILLKGWEVFETDKLSILHYGFRTFEQGRQHTQRDWMVLGAAAAKTVRAGNLGLVRIAMYVLFVDALKPIAGDLVALRTPRGLGRVFAFCRGFIHGLATPVEHSTMIYRRPTARTKNHMVSAAHQ